MILSFRCFDKINKGNAPNSIDNCRQFAPQAIFLCGVTIGNTSRGVPVKNPPAISTPLLMENWNYGGVLVDHPVCAAGENFSDCIMFSLRKIHFRNANHPLFQKKIACGALVTIKHTGSNQHINMSICWLQVEISEISGKKSIWWKDDMLVAPCREAQNHRKTKKTHALVDFINI